MFPSHREPQGIRTKPQKLGQRIGRLVPGSAQSRSRAYQDQGRAMEEHQEQSPDVETDHAISRTSHREIKGAAWQHQHVLTAF